MILAGGDSVRMGYPKPWLAYNESTTFLKQITNVFRKSGINEIVTVINARFATPSWQKELNSVKFLTSLVVNQNSEKGRLHSIRLGLSKISTPFTFIHNVDNPFVDLQICDALLPVDTDDVVIPMYHGKKGHPIVIGKKVMNEILHPAKEYDTLKKVLEGFNIRYVDVGYSSILKNINNPAELAEAIDELD